MRLLAALHAVASFADARKAVPESDPRRWVSVVAPVFDPRVPLEWAGDVPVPQRVGFVAAHDGEVGCMVALDPVGDVPTMALDAAQVKRVLKALGEHEDVHLTRASDALAVLDVHASRAEVPAAGSDMVLAVPALPTRWRRVSAEVLDLVLRAVPAAARDADGRKDLGRLHVTPRLTEASDQVRLVRVGVGVVEEGAYLVAPDLFRSPSRAKFPGMLVGVADGHLWFSTGEELRWAKLLDATGYWDLGTFVPAVQHDSRADVSADTFDAAVAAAVASTPDDLVELTFHGGVVEVRGVAADARTTAAVEVRLAPAAGPAPVRAVFRGKLLRSTSKLFSEIVRLSWREAGPLRFDDDTTTAVVWPLVPGKEPSDGGEATSP